MHVRIPFQIFDHHAIIDGIQVIICINAGNTSGSRPQNSAKHPLALNVVRVVDSGGDNIGNRTMTNSCTESMMIQVTGLKACHIHGKCLEYAAVIHAAVDLTRVIVGRKNHLVGIVALLQAINRTNSGLDGDCLVICSYILDIALKFLHQVVVFDNFFTFHRGAVHHASEANIVVASPLFHDFLDGLQHLDVGSAAKDVETVLAADQVDGVIMMDLGHVDIIKSLTSSQFNQLGIAVITFVNGIRHVGK